MKVRKLYLKQVNDGGKRFRVTKTVDAGTEFGIGEFLNPTQVDKLSYNPKYQVTIT